MRGGCIVLGLIGLIGAVLAAFMVDALSARDQADLHDGGAIPPEDVGAGLADARAVVPCALVPRALVQGAPVWDFGGQEAWGQLAHPRVSILPKAGSPDGVLVLDGVAVALVRAA